MMFAFRVIWMEVTMLFLTFISISLVLMNTYGGLFGYTGSQAEISHIGLTNASVTVTSSSASPAPMVAGSWGITTGDRQQQLCNRRGDNPPPPPLPPTPMVAGSWGITPGPSATAMQQER